MLYKIHAPYTFLPASLSSQDAGGYIRNIVSTLWTIYADDGAHSRCFRKASQADRELLEYAPQKLERSRTHVAERNFFILTTPRTP